MTEFRPICPQQDEAMARIVRRALEAHGLDIPGTAYFDASLDHLSAYYAQPGRSYYVLLRDGTVIGGVGLAPFDGLPGCCELQKLYLAEDARGQGLGYEMIRFIEAKARAMGYRQIYLETHSHLSAAIHAYERLGYCRIDRPPSVVHTTMDRFYLKAL
ncbi:MAG: GNAT family N-acetyltransferase [Clostridia bacterium]|nr:GNAT family N-acetyltransferase [Clostridia bacterium]